MSSGFMRVTFQAMFLTGIILAPIIRADALTDLGDLKTTINSAASVIGSKTNSSRNWGFWPPSSGDVGTAGLVQNITQTILRANYNLGLNQTKWINATTVDNTTSTVNLTETGLDDPYIEYVLTIPNLSTALVAQGRAWHSELNRPVYDAIDVLQQTISAFSTSLLEAGLIHSNSTLRTIRASSTLSDAQTAWSRILNLPGSSHSSSSERRSIAEGSERHKMRSRITKNLSPATLVEITFEEAKLNVKRADRPMSIHGGHYSHKDLWGRETKPWVSPEGKPRRYDRVVRRDERVKARSFNG